MGQKKRFHSIADYVNAQPRTITQGQVARKMGLSDQELSRYMNGRRVPPQAALRLARAFGISLEGMLDPPKVEVAS